MSDAREFDVIVFGATGFAGKYATEYLFHSKLTERWAISGRSLLKLHTLVSGLRKKYPQCINAPTIIAADALGPEEILQRTFSRARVLINCAGPFMRLGKPVVTSAVFAGTHYVDITGEPGHIIGTMLDLYDVASEKGLLIVPACGFDHIPSDIGGYVTVSEELRAAAARQGVTDPKMAIEMFARFKTGPRGYCVNNGTLDSIIEGIYTMRRMSHIFKRMKMKYQRQTQGKVVPYKAKFGFGIGRDARLGPDNPIVCVNDSEMFAVRRTMRLVDMGIGTSEMPGSDTVAFKAYFCLETWGALLKMIISIFMCAFFLMLPGGRKFVLKHSSYFTWGVFSPNGPTEEQVNDCSVEFTFMGRARNAEGKEVAHTIVEGRCPEPAYVATSRLAIAAAFTILEEREKLPAGGVLTPGVAFYRSDIRDRMKKLGALELKVVSS